ATRLATPTACRRSTRLMRRQMSTSPSRRLPRAQAWSSAVGPRGMSDPAKRLVRCDQLAMVSGVVDAEPGGGHRFEARGRDRIAAHLAEPVGAVVHAGHGGLHLLQLVAE